MGRREKNISLKLKICAKSCCTIWKILYKYHSDLSFTRVCQVRHGAKATMLCSTSLSFLFRVGLARSTCDLEVTETDLAKTFLGGRTVAKKKKKAAAKKAAPKKKATKKKKK